MTKAAKGVSYIVKVVASQADVIIFYLHPIQ